MPFLIIITIILSYFPQTRPIAIILSSNGRLAVPEERTLDVSVPLHPENLLAGAGSEPDRADA